MSGFAPFEKGFPVYGQETAPLALSVRVATFPCAV